MCVFAPVNIVKVDYAVKIGAKHWGKGMFCVISEM